MSFFPIVGSQAEKVALPGRLVKCNGDSVLHTSVIAAASGSPQEITITSTAPTNSSTYSGTLSFADISIPFSYLTDGSATNVELADAIAADLLADALIGVGVDSVVSAAGVVTIVMKSGFTGSVSLTANPGTDLVVGGTAAVAATQFKFGRACEATGLLQEGRMQVETVEAPDGSSVVAGFCLVLDDGSDVLLDAVGESEQPVGPSTGRAFLVAKAGARNWYAVEAPSATPSFGGAVYVEGGAGADNGRLFTTGGGSRVLWTGARFIGLDPNDSSIAIVEI